MAADIGREIVDRSGHERNMAHLRALGVALPRISDLADPPSRLAASDDVVLTVATDGAAMYRSEIENARATCFADEFSEIEAAQAFGQHVLGAGIDHVRELTRFERDRIFNLGYYTWVEQQGTSLAQFDGRRDREFWEGLMNLVPMWDAMIDDLNAAID